MALSQARRAEHVGDADLRWIRSKENAQAVQDAAVAAFGGVPVGYTLAATSAATSRLLNCFEPVVGKLVDDFIYDSGSRFRVPFGTLGVGAQFIFVIGLPVREPLTLQSISDAILSCRMGLQLLGRRVAGSVPLNDWSATADFALDVVCVRGGALDEWDHTILEEMEVSLQMNGHDVARGSGAHVLGNPVAAVLWLAQALGAHGERLQPGDEVATGSCTGLAQVVPGQCVRAVFGEWGEVTLNLG